MIPRDFVTEWRLDAPWTSDEQVEQDLVISRAVVEIFRVEQLARSLAWRGGTALHKLYLHPAARYSEDIDLVQVIPEPIGETFDALRAILDPWLGKPKRVLKEGRVNLVYRYLSEQLPPMPMRLKIEINSREHFSALGLAHLPFEVRSRWWSGTATVTCFELDELLGTKLRALFQRKKGRDLFDLWHAVEQGKASPERIVECFDRYMAESSQRVTRAVYEESFAGKLDDPVFRADMTPLLRSGLSWDVDRAAGAVMEALISRLPGDPWRARND